MAAKVVLAYLDTWGDGVTCRGSGVQYNMARGKRECPVCGRMLRDSGGWLRKHKAANVRQPPSKETP